MLNYIILVLLTAVLILSAVTVIAEPIFAGYKGVGRVLREIRIRLRAISRTSFCIWAGVIVIFALAVGDDEPLKVLAAAAWRDTPCKATDCGTLSAFCRISLSSRCRL